MPATKMKHYPLSIALRPFPGKRKNAWLSAVLLFVGSLAYNVPTTLAQVTDLSGKAVEPLKTQGANAIVLLFVRTDCPISKRYTPEIKRLAEKFATSKFYLIYPGADESAEMIKQHHQDYDYKLEALRDPQHELVKTTGVKVTPEVAVYVAGTLVYRGRIDDRVAAFGKLRPAPTVRDLEEVLDAISKGKAVTKKTTTAIGCYIS
jgi:hypothetical protein